MKKIKKKNKKPTFNFTLSKNEKEKLSFVNEHSTFILNKIVTTLSNTRNTDFDDTIDWSLNQYEDISMSYNKEYSALLSFNENDINENIDTLFEKISAYLYVYTLNNAKFNILNKMINHFLEFNEEDQFKEILLDNFYPLFDVEEYPRIKDEINNILDKKINTAQRNLKQNISNILSEWEETTKIEEEATLIETKNHMNTIREYFKKTPVFGVHFEIYEGNKINTITINDIDIPFPDIYVKVFSKNENALPSDDQPNFSPLCEFGNFKRLKSILIEDKETQIPLSSKDNQLKMYSYKELNKIALNKGYTYNRSNGDHSIFTKVGSNPIVIPQKTLGKGIQIKILKDLQVI